MTENVSMGSRESLRKKSRPDYHAINHGAQRRSSRNKDNTTVKNSQLDTQKLIDAAMQENVSSISQVKFPDNLRSLDKNETGSQPSSLPASLLKVHGQPLTEINLCQGGSNSLEPPSVPEDLQPQVAPEASNKSSLKGNRSSHKKQSVSITSTAKTLEQKHVGIAPHSVEKNSSTASTLASKKQAGTSDKPKPGAAMVRNNNFLTFERSQSNAIICRHGECTKKHDNKMKMPYSGSHLKP